MTERKGNKTPDSPDKQTPSWWQRFKAAVEDPHTSIYDFLKSDIRTRLDLEDGEGVSYVLQRAQKKAIKEALELTEPKELRDAIKRLEDNRLFFDYRSRVGIKLFRVLMDTYIVALHGEAKAPPSKEEALAIHDQVEKLIEQELQDPEVLHNVEKLAEELTHQEKDEIRETVEKAQKQLKEKSAIAEMADDAVSLARTFFKPDTMANIAIHALPLITWKYRWALALGLGAFAARKSVYHGAVGSKELLFGDKQVAREEGTKALKALRAAGGNVLAVGLTPVYAKLPKALMGFGVFFADKVFNTTLDITNKIINRPEKTPEQLAEQLPIRTRFKNGIKGFFNSNQDTLTSLTAKALKIEVPHKLTKSFEAVSKRVKLSTVRGVSKDIYSMSRIVLARSFNRLANVCPADQVEQIDKNDAAAEDPAVNEPQDAAMDIQEALVASAPDDAPPAPRL